MKILFIKPAAGLGFGYHAGEEAEINEAQGKELIELGYAEELKRAVEEKPEKIKKAVKK